MNLELTVTDERGNADLTAVAEALEQLRAFGVGSAIRPKAVAGFAGSFEVLQLLTQNHQIVAALIAAVASVIVAMLGKNRKATVRGDGVTITFEGRSMDVEQIVQVLKSLARQRVDD
jgi:hypothetical protein